MEWKEIDLSKSLSRLFVCVFFITFYQWDRRQKYGIFKCAILCMNHWLEGVLVYFAHLSEITLIWIRSNLSEKLNAECHLILSFSNLDWSITFVVYHFQSSAKPLSCPVGWGCRIHRLHLCRGVGPHPTPTSVLIWH